jgi:hypothetical protein
MALSPSPVRSSTPTPACSLHDRPPPPASTPAGGTAEWTTKVAVPKDGKGLYILLSVESGKQRLYANYTIDVTDK